MDVNSKKKTNAVSGSDIDEELEGCLEDLEDIANEIIASSDSECEQKIHKEVNEEKQEYNKDDIKVKEEDNKPNQMCIRDSCSTGHTCASPFPA